MALLGNPCSIERLALMVYSCGAIMQLGSPTSLRTVGRGVRGSIKDGYQVVDRGGGGQYRRWLPGCRQQKGLHLLEKANLLSMAWPGNRNTAPENFCGTMFQ